MLLYIIEKSRRSDEQYCSVFKLKIALYKEKIVLTAFRPLPIAFPYIAFGRRSVAGASAVFARSNGQRKN